MDTVMQQQLCMLFCINHAILLLIYQEKSASYQECGTSLVAQMVKNLPAMQKIRVWSLSWDPVEKGMATHSSILAFWEIPWTEEPGGL